MSREDPFRKVMKTVTRVREPGDKPDEDLKSMDRYICDLCHGIREREEMIQCGFCGRWVCRKNCWEGELKACESCSGLILLAKNEKESDGNS